MDVNAYIAGTNALMAAGMVVLAVTFVLSLLLDGASDKNSKVFLAWMALFFLLGACDYATTGWLRIEELFYVPSFRQAPVGLTWLALVRTLEASILWFVILYVVVWRRGLERAGEEDEGDG